MSSRRRRLLIAAGSLVPSLGLITFALGLIRGRSPAVLVAFGLLLLNSIVITALILWLLQKPADRG